MAAKTRFAPSPTGHLHIGGLRTALFNFLYARHTGGEFILRIEDTDKERSKTEYEKAILEALKWVGISWDNDEIERQSEREDLYKKYINKLLDEGKAYRCFCSRERLEELKKEQLSKGLPPRYDGRCRDLSKEEVNRLLAEGKEFVVRLKVPENEEIVVEDLVQGEIRFNTKDYDDFIIARSDGTPVYNFVVCIDDYLMNISHVIRGVSHLSNTPKQILVYRALGVEPPRFAHVSEIIGKDGKKLSKREGALSILEYRNMGILPDALLNYMALLGWYPRDGKEVKSLEELIKDFDVKDCSKSPSRFDFDKLIWMNKRYISIYGRDKLFDYARQYGFLPEDLSDNDRIKALVFELALQKGMLGDIDKSIEEFFDDFYEIPDEVFADTGIKHYLEYIRKSLLNSNFKDRDDVVSFFKDYIIPKGKEFGLKGKNLFKFIREVFTGKEEGMEIDFVFWVLGKDRLIKRLDRVLSSF